MPATGTARAAKPLAPRYSAAGTKQVWLTFDDGPHPTRTPKVLDVLAAHGIRATFFVIGKNAAFYPKIIQRMVREGHQVANHTYTHPNLTTVSRAKVRSELKMTETKIAAAMGKRKLFRPPYGAHNAKVDAVVAEFGYRTILWSVDTVDWSPKYKPDRWVSHGVEQIRNRTNSVVLMHDIHQTTAGNLDTFIRRIKRIGGVKFAGPETL
jgi:peptidoglycan/xylan/chitin deacetylase (PgdA/CDA1 family)